MQIKRSKEAILTADTYFGIARAFPPAPEGAGDVASFLAGEMAVTSL